MKKILTFIFPPGLQYFASFLFPFVYWPEMLNWPLILSRGWMPYRDFTIIHTPLLPLLATLFYEIFGFSSFNMHLLGTTLLVISNFLIVFIVWKLTGKLAAAVISGLIFICLSLAFEGNTVWFESLLTPIFLLTFYLQITFISKQKKTLLLASGILLGAAVLIKQTALFIFPGQLIFLVYLFRFQHFKIRQLPAVAVCLALPTVLMTGIFLFSLNQLGILRDFYDWGVNFPFLLPHLKTIGVPPDLVLPSFRQSTLIVVFTILGIVTVLRKRNFRAVYALTWMVLSVLFIIPRFEYFHLLPFLSFFSIIFSIGIVNLKNAAILATLVAIFIFPVMRGTFRTGQRFLNPQVKEVANWLNKNRQKETIFSLNGPDLVYFLTNREPGVRPWVDQLPWEMIFFGHRFLVEFRNDQPDLVVFHPYLRKAVNGLGAYQPKEVVDYVFSHYHQTKSFRDGTVILEKNLKR